MSYIALILISMLVLGTYSHLFLLLRKHIKYSSNTDFDIIAKSNIQFSFLGACRKLYLFCYAVNRKLFGYYASWNLKYHVKNQEALYKSKTLEYVDSKTVLFIRHARSLCNNATQNVISNPFLALKDLLTFLALEISLLFSPHTIWFDSPLSIIGINECKALNSFLFKNNSNEFKDELDEFLNSPESDIVWLTSDLRRTQSTLILCFHDRFKTYKDKIYTDPNLTELVLNPDTISISPKGSCLGKEMALVDKELAFEPITTTLKNFVDHKFDYDKQNKLDILARMNNYHERIFSLPAKHIVTVGHSRWFVHYNNLFYKPGEAYALKGTKIKNCSIVKYQLDRYRTKEGKHVYFIKPETQKMLYGSLVDHRNI